MDHGDGTGLRDVPNAGLFENKGALATVRFDELKARGASWCWQTRSEQTLAPGELRKPSYQSRFRPFAQHDDEDSFPLQVSAEYAIVRAAPTTTDVPLVQQHIMLWRGMMH